MFKIYKLKVFILFISFILPGINKGFSQSEKINQIESILNSLEEDKMIADSISKYSRRLFYFGNFEKANEWALKGITLAEKHNRDKSLVDLKIIHSRYLARYDQLDSSLFVLKSLLNKQYKKTTRQEFYIYQNIAGVYSQLNLLDSALLANYHVDSIGTAHNFTKLSNNQISIAELFYKQGLTKRSIEATSKALEISEIESDTTNHLFILFRAAELFYVNNALDKYAHSAKEYIELSELVNSKP